MLLKYGLAALVVTGSYWLTYNYGAGVGETRVLARWNEQKAKDAEAARLQQQQFRNQEAVWHEERNNLTDQLHRAQLQTLNEVDTSLANLRSDNVRLRERFRRCEADAGMPQNTDTASRSDGADGARLSEGDKAKLGALFRIGGRADQCVARLTALQGYVTALATTGRVAE